MNIPIPDFTEAESAIVAEAARRREAGLDGHLIEPAPLQRIAAKPVK